MGKGLSKLQKTILCLAYGNATHGRDHQLLKGSEAEVKYPEVLAEYFGWEKVEPQSRSYIFSKKDIGEKAYRSARVSLTRAFSRLESRGLIERSHSTIVFGQTGATLTEEGREVARQLAEQLEK